MRWEAMGNCVYVWYHAWLDKLWNEITGGRLQLNYGWTTTMESWMDDWYKIRMCMEWWSETFREAHRLLLWVWLGID